MEKVQAFQTRSLSEGIVAFAQFARSHGMNIGVQETQDALMAADAGLLKERTFFRAALKSIFCHAPEEMLVFDRLFFAVLGYKSNRPQWPKREVYHTGQFQ